MHSNPRHNRPHHTALLALLIIVWPMCAEVCAQAADAEESTDKRSDRPALLERQRLIRDRLGRLESRMLKLSSVLGENEPEKAERLRDALQFVGRHQIKTRVTRLTRLLENDQFSDAEREQDRLLKDLDMLLALLTSPLSDAERRRAERKRLEEFKRSLRVLLDEQTQILYRTQQAEQRADITDAQPTAGASGDVAEMLRQIERLQRQAKQKAGDLREQMKKGADSQQPAPGTDRVEQAEQRMARAADELGGDAPKAARQEQQKALEQLQAALDDLEDALRQVRREETEETLAALEARFRSMLTRQREVLDAVRTLAAKDAEQWARIDELRLAEAVETQRGVADDCGATLRILIDEGTTVIVPELVRQAAADMHAVAERLEQADVSAETRGAVEDIVALLEEILDAIERKREADTRASEGGQNDGDGPRPLLPGSAELKLLRSSQLRLNQRTRELAEAKTPSDQVAARRHRLLAERQRRLAELARRMNERQ